MCNGIPHRISTGQSDQQYDPPEWSEEEQAAYNKYVQEAFEKLSDYQKALVECGAWVWTGSEFTIASPLGGKKGMDCPSSPKFE